MKWYLITYDLNVPGQDYNRLYSRIQAIANGCCAILESTWIIGHSCSAEDVYRQLQPALDKNDFIFITELTWNCIGFFDKGAVDWFNRNIRL